MHMIRRNQHETTWWAWRGKGAVPAEEKRERELSWGQFLILGKQKKGKVDIL